MNIFAGIMSLFGLGSPQEPPPPPPRTYLVRPSMVADEKAVFATVQSANVVPARARIGGTIVELKVRQGDHVEQGQVIATVSDASSGCKPTPMAHRFRPPRRNWRRRRSTSIVRNG